MSQVIAVAEILRCKRCGKPLAENYGSFIYIKHHGYRARFYDPRMMAIDCRVCKTGNIIAISPRNKR